MWNTLILRRRSKQPSDGDPDRDKIPRDAYARLPHLFAKSLAGWPARAGEMPFKKGEKCHQVLCRIEGMEGSESQRGPNADERRKTKRS